MGMERCGMKLKKFNGRIVRHKYVTVPIPSKSQPNAVRILYLCTKKEANWKKTDITNLRVNCKKCRRIMKNEILS